jgi:hypothetical protein
MSRTLAGLALLSILVAAAWLGVAAICTPDPRPASAPPDEFSAERGLAHVRTLAAEPRPLGSAAHERARAYVVGQLEELGLHPTVQDGVGRSRWGRGFGSVQNVLARLPGADGEPSAPAVLLMAHYDSVPAGPGASDDAVGVAVLLETLRALQAGPPLGHDVIALFSDGEEGGLLGAEAFAQGHPWAEDVTQVLNFEARGTRGPSLMFETGADNLWLIRRFAAAVPHPMAASYSYEVYRRLPNDTDYSVFRSRGIDGLNFAHIHGAVGYHTQEDSVARVDAGSLQHHGESALALARELSASDLAAGANAQGDAVYFNPWGSFFVWFPASWVLPLLVVLVLASLVVLALGVRRRRPGLGGLAGGLAFWVVSVALVGLVGAFARALIFPVPYDFRIWGDASSFAWGLFGWALVALGLAAALYVLGRRWVSAAGTAAGGLLLWLVVTVVASLAAPGASYLFLIPLAVQLVAVGWLATRPEEAPVAPMKPARVPVGVWLLLAAAGIVVALVWAPTLALVGVGLQLGAVAVLGALGALLLALLAAQLEVVTAIRPRFAVPSALLVAGVALVVAVRVAGGFSPDNPRPTSLFYALDADAGRAVWASFDRRPSPWTAAVLPETGEWTPLADFLGNRREVATGPAPVLDLPVPTAVVEEAPAAGSGGTYRVRVVPPPGTDRLRLQLGPAASVRALTVGGREAELPTDGGEVVDLVYLAPPAGGVELTAELAAGAAPKLAAVAQWFRLPSEADGGPPARGPALMQTGSGWDSDSTMVRVTLPLDGASAMPEEPAETVSAQSDPR